MPGEGTQRTVIHTQIPSANTATVEKVKIRRVRSGRSKLTFSERLLRNTAIACALLLSILAVRNIDQPWSNAAVGGIESALTMRIDFDQSLGKLNFVRSIMPESSFVFFNISGMAPAQPVAGEVKHAFSEGQPWTMYRCDESAEVRAAMAGTVRAVVQLGSGDFCVLIDHGEGVETMYGYLDLPLVAQGATVARAESLGALRGDTLYYEMRVDGVSVDPEGAAH